MALYKAEGIVLRSREWGEADRLLTLLTKSQGKLRAVARGVRRPRSRLIGCTQLFVHGRYLLFEGKSWDTISQGEICHAYAALREDLARMAYASYFAELVDRLVEEREPHPSLFHLVGASFEVLGAAAHLPPLARSFELKLMSLLGYHPALEECAGCGVPAEPVHGWRFSAEEGGLLCPQCAGRDPGAEPVTAGAVAAMRRLLGRPLSEAPVMRLGSGLEGEVERAVRSFLAARLGQVPKSLSFLAELGV